MYTIKQKQEQQDFQNIITLASISGEIAFKSGLSKRYPLRDKNLKVLLHGLTKQGIAKVKNVWKNHFELALQETLIVDDLHYSDYNYMLEYAI